MAVMQPMAMLLAFMLSLVGCGSATVPTASPTGMPTEPPPVLLPLPAGLSGIPRPGTPTVVIQPRTQRGTIVLGVAQPVELGHCGLVSPIDFDGSLWDPIAGDNGAGGALTDEHQGELINATRVTLTLIEPDVLRLETPLGAVLRLVRHSGARPYSLCD
jgi:hypothetical protein